MTFYHGGISGVSVGDRVVPAPPHVEDGCPICLARAAGRVYTVGEYRTWLLGYRQDPRAQKLLRDLAQAPADQAMDPPSKLKAVYITTSLPYATFYAARSCGDLYQVKPEGDLTPSGEDHFPAFTVESARVVAIIRRGVQLTRTERRRIEHLWKKADRRVEKQRYGHVL